MSQTFDLTPHVSFNQHHRTEKICKILFQQSAIQYFAYQRIYADGSFTFLASRTDLASYFAEDNNYIHAWLFNVAFEKLQSGVIFWDVAKCFGTPDQNKVTEAIVNHLKLGYGMDLLEKHEHYCDVFSFASSSPNIYHCSIPFLREFIFYYRQEGNLLLKQAWQEKIILTLNDPDPEKDIPIVHFESSDKKIEPIEFNLKRYYLNESNPDVYLTKKEILCLREMANHATMKEAARIIGIEHRTVEAHIRNIKEKLGCSYLSQIISIAKENHFI